MANTANSTNLNSIKVSAIDSGRSIDNLKKLVTSITQSVVPQADYGTKLQELLASTEGHYKTISDALGHDYLSTIAEPPHIDNNILKAMDADARAKRKDEWTRFTLNNTLRVLLIRGSVIKSLLDNKPQKLLRTAMSKILTQYAREKRNTMITDSAINGIMSALKLVNAEHTMALIDILDNLGFIKLEKIKLLDGNKMFAIEPKITRAQRRELRAMWFRTNKRNLKFTEPRVVEEGQSLVIRKDHNYHQPITEPAAKSINWLNVVPFEFTGDINGFIEEFVDSAVENAEYSAWAEPYKDMMRLEAGLAEEAGRFYITRQTDSVGRMYEQSKFGFHQGGAMKEHIAFANKKALDDEGRKAYRQFVVNEVIGYRPNGIKPTEEEAEDYWNTHDMGEYQVAHDSTEPTGMWVEVDAQTQGFSLYALAAGNRMMCDNSAVIGDSKRTDAYLTLAQHMNDELGIEAFDRKSVKAAFMTKGYGAGYKTIMFGSGTNADFDFDTGEYVIHSGSKKAIPLMETAEKHGLGSKEVWKAFKKAMKLIAPEMLNLQTLLSDIQGAYNEDHDTSVISWTMPDGIIATVAPMRTLEDSVQWADKTGHVHTTTHYRKVEDRENTTALAPRVIQSVDAYIARFVANMCADNGVELAIIHDGYISHPNDAYRVMDFYRQALADVFERDLLTDIISQISGTKAGSVRRGSITVDEILSSKYALWF